MKTTTVVSLPIPAAQFSEKLRWLGNKFIELDDGKNTLNFHAPYVHKKSLVEECGTIACHAGWGCVIFDLTPPFLWSYGANAIAYHLGFKFWQSYTIWAMFHKEIWGNQYGDLMFSSDGAAAFNVVYQHECTLKTVGQYYLGLAGRVDAAAAEGRTVADWNGDHKTLIETRD